ncbi:N-acetyltransferase [Leifsonia sp. NPDC080035]|uniref:N-acetyltransferase n=1 Tax=Leifsonia sp. NPDC080035 TaxID=3143936 RepID=A0AAU7G912_9MICO
MSHFTHVPPSGIPDRLVTDAFTLRPLRVADTALDYDAVMESRVYLRPWEQTGWPADDFTFAEDLEDVTMLEHRHDERQAFTYTVLSPDESECLGCVYILPPDARHYREATVAPAGDAEWEDVGALVSFWVRTSRLASGLDVALLDSVRAWLAQYPRLGRPLYVTNERVDQQVAMLKGTELQLLFRITKPTHPGSYLAFG